MSNKGTVIVLYDAPPEADAWMHGPHYDEVNRTPGVIDVRRYETVTGPDGCRRYIALIESDDIDATLAWRDSLEGQRSQGEANDRGVANRYAIVAKRIY
ncbi:MAG: hypothetical protein ABIN08_21195 [Caldimonas sp.]